MVTGASSTALSLPAYPGSVVIKQKQEQRKAELAFQSGASLSGVFAYYDNYMRGQGWQQTKLDPKNNKTEAEYVRNGQKTKLKVEQKSHGYKVEFNL